MDEKEFRLKESMNFCILPWMHIHIMPDGQAMPCCISTRLFFFKTN